MSFSSDLINTRSFHNCSTVNNHVLAHIAAPVGYFQNQLLWIDRFENSAINKMARRLGKHRDYPHGHTVPSAAVPSAGKPPPILRTV
ncbi:MAG: hypothetical protein M2R45_04492 [Verrucomicrobia subdivision 3 bacterium]|nr:hypothetical protein [Limisphaerales bacterium]MCS1412664.1 hypothetical protein [Limisphaerales bacterium]